MREMSIVATEEDRALWYRIPEREKTRTPANLKIGTRVYFNQWIIRAGYYYMPDDMPLELQIENAKLLFEKKLLHFYKMEVSRKEIDVFIEALELLNETKALRHLMYKARGEWLKEKRGKSERLRSFWYLNNLAYYQNNPYVGTIVLIKPKWVGVTYSASGGQTWDGEYWYEPGGMNDPVFQQIYMVDMGYQQMMVHPLDVCTKG